jgi:hypothetical protein
MGVFVMNMGTITKGNQQVHVEEIGAHCPSSRNAVTASSVTG